jgi:hypothetical protein
MAIRIFSRANRH